MLTHGLTNLIMTAMRAQARKPCKTDPSGNCYITCNAIIRGFGCFCILLSLLVLGFMPMYFDESRQVGLLLLVVAPFLFIFGVVLLKLRYTLTQEGLEHGVFGKLLPYRDIQEAAHSQPPALYQENIAMIPVAKGKSLNIPMENYSGSFDFLKKLEENIGLAFAPGTKQKPKVKPLRMVIGLLALVALGYYIMRLQ